MKKILTWAKKYWYVLAGIIVAAAGTILYFYSPDFFKKYFNMAKGTLTNSVTSVDEAGERQTQSFEGYETTVYALDGGTVGWGHKVLPEDNLKVGDTIDTNQAAAFWEKDKDRTNNLVNDGLTVDVTQPIFNALFSFTYNTGVNKSTLYDLINAGNLQAAADWIKVHYTTDNGKELPGLVTRRGWEADQIQSAITA